MFSSATDSVIRKWGQWWFPNVGKNPPRTALNMHLLFAVICSTDACCGCIAIEQTQLHVTFTYTFVVWMLHERHVDYRIGMPLIRMGNRVETTLQLNVGRQLNQNLAPNKLWMSAST